MQERGTILVVDDTAENLMVLGDLLQPDYRVRVANSGARALLAAVSEPVPDLILLDVMMPGMDGHTVLRRLKSKEATRDIPVIFVTAMGASVDEEFGLELGAVDYITKPIRPSVVLARIRSQLDVKRARDWLKDKNSILEREISRRMHDNQLIQDVSIRALAGLAEARDIETGLHIRRTQAYVEVLARHLRTHPRFADYLTDAMTGMVIKAAPLHDIGKVGIPDSILLKPGPLTGQEFAIMKSHTTIGAEAINQALSSELSEEEYRQLQHYSRLDADPAEVAKADLSHIPLVFLSVAKGIALWHHEKWDGSGYPDGLAGDLIPIPARLMALADVFDAVSSPRVYKLPIPFDEAATLIRDNSGRHFDPDIVAAFMANLDTFRSIQKQHADNDRTLQDKRNSMKEHGLI